MSREMKNSANTTLTTLSQNNSTDLYYTDIFDNTARHLTISAPIVAFLLFFCVLYYCCYNGKCRTQKNQKVEMNLHRPPPTLVPTNQIPTSNATVHYPVPQPEMAGVQTPYILQLQNPPPYDTQPMWSRPPPQQQFHQQAPQLPQQFHQHATQQYQQEAPLEYHQQPSQQHFNQQVSINSSQLPVICANPP